MQLFSVGKNWVELYRGLASYYRASGGLAKKRPQLFLTNKKTKTLVTTVESNAGIPALSISQGGNHSGTFAHEDVAFAYAAWIDDAFYSVVFQVFGATVRGDTKKVREIVRSCTAHCCPCRRC